MQVRVSHFCMIMNFLDIGFISNEISEILKIEVDELLVNNKLTDHNEWLILFEASYNNGRHVLVTKNKLGNLRSEKTKEIVIVVPIPLLYIVPWGVNQSDHINKPSHYDDIIQNFWVLENRDITTFINRKEYILDCMRRGINKAFKEGFTVGGVKIKINPENDIK